MSTKKAALGRGISAIIGNQHNDSKTSGFDPDFPINEITPNPDQPRMRIEPDELIGLADSIREYGVIEPLIITKLGNEYQLVAGERRWRAAQLAKIQTVPVIIKEVSPKEVLEMALIENLQRKDLNVIEEAHAYKQLVEQFNSTLDEIGKKVGKDITTISNKMRILKLPKLIQDGLLEVIIYESHAYQILKLKSEDAQLAAYNIVRQKGLNVAQTEELIQEISLANKGARNISNNPNAKLYDERTAEIKQELQGILGRGFKLTRKKLGGNITIPFQNDDQLEKIREFIRNNEQDFSQINMRGRKKQGKRVKK
jgi:ParB family chromosome partitioning protein